jgi:hypothetical protein
MTPLTDKLLDEAQWRGKDAFPSDDTWRHECEKWLRFVESKEQLGRFWPRLICKHPKRRDETFSEIEAAYYLETQKGFPIVGWEPNGQGNTKGEFSINVNGVDVFCEVKSPGWEGELSEEERAEGRIEEGKWKPGAECRSISTWKKIRFAITKAYAKFPSDKPALLIIVDDLFAPITFVPPEQIAIALFEKRSMYNGEQGYFVNDNYNRLSGILFLNVENLDWGKLEYKAEFRENPSSLHSLRIALS